MPIANVQDAQEVERSLKAILTAPDLDSPNLRLSAVLFVETLDYDSADQRVSLQPSREHPIAR